MLSKSTPKASLMSRIPLLALPLILAPLVLSGCMGFGGEKDLDLATYVEETDPADQLYNEGLANMNAGRMSEAVKKFDAVDRQHPYSEFARKSLVMGAFAQYRQGNYDESVNSAKRYVSLYPSSPDAAYAQYIIGLSYHRQIRDVTQDQKESRRAIEAMEEVERLLRTGRYCAVGEIGIDLYWDKTWLVQQQDVFRKQVRWAKELDLPIVIHCRESFVETMTIVEQEKTADLRGVFHCFTGPAEHAQRILALDDFYLGIGGVITYPKSGLAQTMAVVGPDRCMLETDSPYLAPVPHRGKRNESSYIPVIAQALASATSRTLEEIAQITTRNAQILFS